MTKAVNFVLLSLVLGFLLVSDARAQSTEIAYQGNLKVSGLPANASYDFEFRLYDEVSGGTQIGPLVSLTSVTVTEGVFSVKLNFGPSFPGPDRYLDINVRPAGGGGFTPLNPRQKIGSVPYAIQSINAGNSTFSVNAQNASSLGGVAAAQYVLTTDPRMTNARNPVAGSSNYVQNTNSLQASSNFNISGTGSAATFNATAAYNFGGNHLISALGLNNVFVGVGSGLLNTGTYNAFVGGLAGFENKGGSNNAFFGAEAGKNNSFGNNNSFFGAFAGNATTTGSDNSFFGHRSGLANTAGEYNSFFGTYAGTFNTTGSDNSFFGNSTGFNSNGNRNSFFGSKAGNTNTTGSDNSFVGSFAGNANTTGSNNAFVGSSSGSLNATGVNNSFFGSNSGFANTASNNSFFGMDSGRFNTSGSNNSFFGRGSGSNNTTGQLNVFVGVNAGGTNTSGEFNTVIGAEAQLAGTNLSYATAIGAEAVVSTSNTLVLGRPADQVRIPGNVNVLGNFSAASLTISATNITGILGTANGGTGLSSVGMAGHFLRSNGSGWASSPFTVADVPSGSSHYVHNTTVQQGTSNFNISGNGTAGGTLSANAVNSVTQYSIANNRVLSNAGIANLFAGAVAGNANTTGGSNSFFGHSAGSLNNSAGSNSFFGASAGLNNTSGPGNTFAGASSGSGNSTGANNSFFGSNAGQMNTIGGNNTLIGANSNLGANNLSYASAIGADAVVSTNNTIVLGRSADTVRAAGNLHVNGTLTASIFSIPASSLTGVVATANGGTGLAASGSPGNFLRSNGSAWTSSAIAAADIPAGSANYVQNSVGLQASSNFNISGAGTVGGLFSANAVNITTNYQIGGTRVFATGGINNIFVGAGTATTGDNNSFIGANSATSNTTGTSNTIIGSGANVGAGNLIFATALGSGAFVNDNNSVVLGRAADTVRVPGNLTVAGTFTAPLFTIPATNITGILAAGNGGTGLNTSTGTSFLRGNGTGGWTSGVLLAGDIPTGSANYIQNGVGAQTASFNITGTATIAGGLSLGGPLTGSFTLPAGNITGILAAGNGGTGLNSSTATNFLRGNGSGGWTSGALLAADIPTGSTNYIQNGVGVQTSSNFNISGNGTVGLLFTATTVNSTTNYQIGGARVFAANGINNVFVGADTATTGSSNTFVGDNTGISNSTGNSNTILGANANVGLGNLSFATAIGSGAVVNNNDSVVLGRAADTVRVPGNLTVTGAFTAPSFTIPAANITGILAAGSGGTGLNTSTATNFLRGNGTGGWTSGLLLAADIPTGSANYIQNGGGAQAASFNITGTGTIGGGLSLGGPLTGSFTIPSGNITGILAAGNGGTGLNTSTGTSFLRGNGTGGWTSGALVIGDIPNLATSYIQNGTSVQGTSDFNISGTGTVGGLFTANIVNSTTNYQIGGTRVLASNGINNIFVGADTATTGSSNTFVGKNAGASNTTGNSNTLLGANTNVGAANLSFATAVGSGAVVNNNDSVVLGRAADTVRVPGNLTVSGTFTAPSLSVPAANITGILAAGAGGTGLSSSTATNFLRGNGSGGWTNGLLLAADLPTGSASYIQNGVTPQSGDFNVGGSGTVGGTFSANAVNSVTQYNIGGNRVFTTTGTSNIFAGANTGTSGSSNSFFGNGSGSASTGNSNTLIGANADAAAGVSNSSAIGANALVEQNNSVVLGSTGSSVGVGTTTPKSKLDVTGGHILVGSPGQGIILKSPDGSVCKLFRLDNTGNTVLDPIACP